MPDFSRLMGWIPDGRHEIFARGLPVAQHPPLGLYGDTPEPTHPIVLYQAWKHVLGKYPGYPAQEIGDCVSFASAHANDLLQCIEIYGGEPSIYQETSTEFVYGISREIAGLLGNPSDGCYGSAAARGMAGSGLLSRQSPGATGPYDGDRAKKWGTYGVPDELRSPANAFKLSSVTRIPDWDTLVAALWNLHPVTVCSSQGFTMARDHQGFCQPLGVWNHAMFFAGARFDRPGALICQSWGSETPGGPLDLDQPPFSFWADRAIVSRMLAAGDSWALTGSPEFAVKEEQRRRLRDRLTWS